MNTERLISVVIVDQQIESRGIIANAVFVLGLTAGRELPRETFGDTVIDGDGKPHHYLTNIGHYVRKAGQNKLKTLRETFASNSAITLIDYPEDAAPSDYSEYSKNLSLHTSNEITYRALHVYGPESVIAPLTKNLSRLD